MIKNAPVIKHDNLFSVNVFFVQYHRRGDFQDKLDNLEGTSSQGVQRNPVSYLHLSNKIPLLKYLLRRRTSKNAVDRLEGY